VLHAPRTPPLELQCLRSRLG